MPIRGWGEDGLPLPRCSIQLGVGPRHVFRHEPQACVHMYWACHIDKDSLMLPCTQLGMCAALVCGPECRVYGCMFRRAYAHMDTRRLNFDCRLQRRPAPWTCPQPESEIFARERSERGHRGFVSRACAPRWRPNDARWPLHSACVEAIRHIAALQETGPCCSPHKSYAAGL